MATSASALTSLSFFSSSLYSSSPSSFSLPKFAFSHKASPKPFSITIELASFLILSFSGDKVGETYLDLKSSPLDTFHAIIHRIIITDQQNKHRGMTSMLNRSKVCGGGVKLFPQKKTCKERRGSQHTLLGPGGRVVFGPKPKDWSIKINRNEKRLELSTVLASAAAGSTIMVEDFRDKFEKPGMKAFIEAMKRWGLDLK